MTRRGFVYFDWNVNSGDKSGADYDVMLWEVPSDVAEQMQADKRAVVLFHDDGLHTSWVIDDIIKSLKSDSSEYIFAVIDENTRPMQN
jgi:hypothetical protein